MRTQQHAGGKDNADRLVVWACPLPSCDRVMVFRGEKPETRRFMIVHHLAHKHGWTRSDVLNYNDDLRDTADEYRGFPTDRHGRVM